MALLLFGITPHKTTGKSPSQLRWGRRLRSRMDLLRPDIEAGVQAAQSKEKRQHDQHSQMRQLKVGDAVNVRNCPAGPKWIPGTVIQYTVCLVCKSGAARRNRSS